MIPRSFCSGVLLLVCLPREIRRYTGSIARHQNKGDRVTYEVQIRHKDLKLSKSFKTEAKADNYLCETNVREGLLIRNKFTIFEDGVLVELPGDKLLICDYDNLYLVEMHTWCCSRGMLSPALAVLLLCNVFITWS